MRAAHGLPAGLVLVWLCALASAAPPARGATGQAVLAGALVLGTGLILAGAAALIARARKSAERLRHEEALAEARAVSIFADEALGGLLELSDMGGRVERERGALRLGAWLMIGSAVLAAAAGTAAALGSWPSPGSWIASAAAMAAVALLAFAGAIGRLAAVLGPTEETVHAALIRHEARAEAERRMLGPSLAALAGAVVADAPRSPAA
jgi:hypothetical protein